jgi:hypothetical protein
MDALMAVIILLTVSLVAVGIMTDMVGDYTVCNVEIHSTYTGAGYRHPCGCYTEHVLVQINTPEDDESPQMLVPKLMYERMCTHHFLMAAAKSWGMS